VVFDLIERVLATDIKDVRADKRLKLATALELGYMSLIINTGNDKSKGPLSRSAMVRQALDLSIDREASTKSCSTASSRLAISGSARSIPIIKRRSGQTSRRHQSQGSVEASRRKPPGHGRCHGAAGRGERSVAQVIQSMAAEAGFDLKIRLLEFATSLKQAQAANIRWFLLGWSGRIDPDGNSYGFHTPRRRRTRPTIPTPRPTRRSKMRA